MTLPAQGHRLDPERGVDAMRWFTHIAPPAPPVSTEPVPVTMAERLAAYRKFAARRVDFVLRHEGELLGVIAELIERVEVLEGKV
jgi:hypothetical protein